jgi:nitric oxide reductase NorE protein
VTSRVREFDVPQASTGSGKSDRSTPMPGVEGFWVFIAGDLGLFTLLFGSFLAARSADVDGFVAAQESLSATHGGVNTLLLLSSSWAVARGLVAARAGNSATATRFVGWGIAGGAGFAVSKLAEYAVKLGHGDSPGSNEFLMYYFVLTGIHFVHVLVGLLLLSLMLKRWQRSMPAQFRGAESLACYWHMVDLLWIFLFPLLYLLR